MNEWADMDTAELIPRLELARRLGVTVKTLDFWARGLNRLGIVLRQRRVGLKRIYYDWADVEAFQDEIDAALAARQRPREIKFKLSRQEKRILAEREARFAWKRKKEGRGHHA
jgi:hypothetical protein